MSARRRSALTHGGARVAALLALIVGLPAVALADIVPSRVGCPLGSSFRTSHEGARCLVAECADDGDCGFPTSDGVSTLGVLGFQPPGYPSCRAHRVCTRAYDVDMHGRGGVFQRTERELQVVTSCRPDESCAGGDRSLAPTVGRPVADAECEVRRVCVDEPAPPFPGAGAEPSSAPARAAGCACRATGSSASGGLGGALGLLFVFGALRLARRSA